MKKSSMKTARASKKIAPSRRTEKKAVKSNLFQLASIPGPDIDADARVDRVASGLPIPPVVRVRTFSPIEWEQFIQEWTQSLKADYQIVLRCGGAGDMGRDVVAYTGKPSQRVPWDNYQCKHYEHPLRPGDIWLELGKLVFYTFEEHFTVPRAYYFVCPQDVGTSVIRMLGKPEQLRSGLIENWDKKCRTGISKSKTIHLAGKLRKFIDSFPFEIVSIVPVLKIIEQHRTTPWYVHRFGGGLPDRPKKATPPGAVAKSELNYVAQLLAAYTESNGETVTEVTIKEFARFRNHFLLSRASFYSAESLGSFSRDHLPPGEFRRLQDEIHDGVQETYIDDFSDGYEKVKAVTKAAVNLPITDHALLPVMEPADKRGICHQLVQAERLRWVEDG